MSHTTITMEQNPRLELAFNFVQYTDKNIFLTGKAGTGKTTFLHNLKQSSAKRMAVVAPTGIAAINAGGVTINSFFQLPFGPYIPGLVNKSAPKRFNRDKINLLKSLDLLIIDEISMVRADTVDHIDEVLRQYRRNEKPFGGVQILMIGDLHQLSPVVKDDDWSILKDYYPNLFFFSSKALKSTFPISIELTKIYRQADDTFISLLNHVRKNEISPDVLAKLNERYIPEFEPEDDEGYITLTTHNLTAQKINEEKLRSLDAAAKTFLADIQNDFPEYSYPTVAELELKVGAQVMFVKNDPGRDKLYYNGKIGIIRRIEQDTIFVKCPADYDEIAVSRVEWQNIKYELNTQTKEVEERTIGSFTQFPLKLAWAITIHKSQGLTFERAIIDANLAFAHGQVYVALSRCKSFEGMVLRSAISYNSVKTDGTVAEFSRNASTAQPDELQLQKARSVFQQNLLLDLFDFKEIKTNIFQLKKLAQDHYRSLPEGLYETLKDLHGLLEKDIYQVSETFRRQLQHLMKPDLIPQNDPVVMERVRKGCIYFSDKIKALLVDAMGEINTNTDNMAVGENIRDIEAELSKEIAIKSALLRLSSDNFNTLAYLQTKANCEIDLQKDKSTKAAKARTSVKLPSNTPHPGLYVLLRAWRDNLAEEKGVPAYHVLAQKSLLEILKALPSTPNQLNTIKGIGKMKLSSFGHDILEIINNYCAEHGIERDRSSAEATSKSKTDTRQVSFELFKAGKAIAEIAAERGLTTTTIENHLTSYISNGGLSVFDLVPAEYVKKISAFFDDHPAANSSEAKAALGADISYTHIRAVRYHKTIEV